ncbi:MAG: proline--tRNA ligase [Candidatus Doudnabacteria bacterium]|nr:proline--tRNA ligase [Candidatus Doudnabacteria bacterium]
MVKTYEKKGLTKKSENISDWYHDVVLRAGLADYSEVKGAMIIKPDGYSIWEKVQSILDSWFKKDGVRNVYFPLFIPYSLIKKEKEHLQGFSPELAVVEHAGGEKLSEPLVIRPTSETIMYKTFVDWIQSWRDLPLKVNQWCNIVRWEKRTYPFLRTSEFLWQEGHTVHRTPGEAEEMVLKALGWYKKFYEDYFALSVYAGLKSKGETFAGARETYSIELVMPDGKALQAATSHNLSDNFSKVFGIEFLDETGKKVNPFQTSWGLSTRAIGGLVLTHGDDSGLVLPPKIAFTQVVILPIVSKDVKIQEKISQKTAEIHSELVEKGINAVIDDDFKSSLGFRINKWELKGVSLRLELGAKELESETIQYVRRDNFEKGQLKFAGLEKSVADLLEQIQSDLYKKSEETKLALTLEADEIHEFKRILGKQKAFIRVPWCEDLECENRVKADTKATPRVLELENINQNEDLKCFACGKKARRKWLFAQSY